MSKSRVVVRPVLGALFLVVAAIAVQEKSARAAEVDWSKAQTVDVVATDYAFDPNHFAFRHGQPYHIHLVNRGKDMHEFNAAAMFKASRIRNPEALNADKTELQVQPGQQADLYFVPLQPGSYKLICPDHDWAGMTGEITVE